MTITGEPSARTALDRPAAAALHLTKLGPRFGAQVHGLDLARLDAAQIDTPT